MDTLYKSMTIIQQNHEETWRWKAAMTKRHIYKIAKKTPQQNFEGNTTIYECSYNHNFFQGHSQHVRPSPPLWQ
jgi:hypothetical protein